jgi:hypothetical protein
VRAIDYFDKASEVFPDRIALIDGDVRFTYRELRAASERVARAMRAAGLCDEERVAIYSPNDARVLVCMLGILCAGGTWVPINYRNAIDANVDFMNYVETRWLFYHGSFGEQVKALKSPSSRSKANRRIGPIRGGIPTGWSVSCPPAAPPGQRKGFELRAIPGALSWKWPLTTGSAQTDLPCVSAQPRFLMRQDRSHSLCSVWEPPMWSCRDSMPEQSSTASNFTA